MTRQNPRRTHDEIVAAFIIILALVSGCTDDAKDHEPSSKSSPTSQAKAATSNDVKISAFMDGPGWRVVAFFPRTTTEAAPTDLKVFAADGSLAGAKAATQGGDLAETPCSFYFEAPVSPVIFRWTRRDGSEGERTWRFPQ